MTFHEHWIHLRSPIGHTVEVHPSEHKKADVFRRHGWEQFAVKPVSLAELMGQS